MGRELIRNGGFEDGVFNFWTYTAGMSMLDNAIKHRGSWCVKALNATGDTEHVKTRDYVQVSERELYLISWWFKLTTSTASQVMLFLYDSDLNEIKNYRLETFTGGDYWKQGNIYFVIPEVCDFIQIKVQVLGEDAVEAYIDDVSLRAIDIDKVAADYQELIDVVDDTTKHTVTGDEFFTGIWKEAEYFFDLDPLQRVADGADVTLDVKIETYDPETETWRDAMVFQQVVTTTNAAVTTHEYKRLTGNLGWKQRVSYTTAGAGTISDCDFNVGVVYKR